jgi:hypothetical protein
MQQLWHKTNNTQSLSSEHIVARRCEIVTADDFRCGAIGVAVNKMATMRSMDVVKLGAERPNLIRRVSVRVSQMPELPLKGPGTDGTAAAIGGKPYQTVDHILFNKRIPRDRFHAPRWLGGND